MLTIVLAELPTGAVADMLGKKWSVFLGYIFSAVAFAFLPFNNNFLFIAFLYSFVLPIGESFLSGAKEALIYDSLKQDGLENKYAKIKLNKNLVFQTGLIISSVLSGFMYQYNFYLPFIAIAFAYYIAAALCLLFIEPSIDTEVFTLKNYLKQINFGAREIFKNSFLRKLSSFYVIVGAITWSSILYFNKFLLVELGFADNTRGVIDAIIRVIIVFVLTALMKNKRLFTKKKSIFFFPIFMAISYLPGFILGKWNALPFLAGVMMLGTARFVILGQMVNQEFSSKYRSTAISTLSMLVSLFYIILTFISGPVIVNFGGVRMVYTLLGILSLVTVLPLAVSIVREEK